MAKVRMQDIADRLGVSAVTVHNALAGKRGVSDSVREKVLNTAKEMGYFQERRSAGTLRNIGVIISERYLANYTTFYWKMYQELMMEASNLNCMVSAEILKWETEKNMLLPRFVQENAVEGLIIMGEIGREYIDFLRGRIRQPVVMMDFYYKEVADDAVVSDGFYGTYLLTEYLYNRGFREIAFVGSVHATSSIMDRYCGYYRSVLEHGLTYYEEWRMEDRKEDGEIVLKLPEHMPEAFVCNCDLVASHLIDLLRESGYRVPEDVSVVGFDNYLYPGLPNRDITTYEVDMRGMANAALKKIVRRIEQPDRRQKLSLVSGFIVEKGSVRTTGNGR